MGIGLFIYGSKNMHFEAMHCISNNLVHLRLYQHLQDAHVGSICRMQLRPVDVVASPDILRLFHWFLD